MIRTPRALLAACVLCGALACKSATLVYDTTPGQAEAAAAVARVRLTAARMGSARVSVRDGQVVVELPARHRQRAQRVLEPRGVLRFARVDDDLERMKLLAAHVARDEQAQAQGISWKSETLRGRSDTPVEDTFLTGGSLRLLRYLSQLPPALAPAEGHQYVVGKMEDQPARSYYLDVRDALSITHVREAKLAEEPLGLGGYVVDLKMTPGDRERFGQLTTSLVGKRIAVLVDETVLIVPRIMSPLTTGQAQLITDRQRDSTAELAAILTGGALPAPLVLRTP